MLARSCPPRESPTASAWFPAPMVGSNWPSASFMLSSAMSARTEKLWARGDWPVEGRPNSWLIDGPLVPHWLLSPITVIDTPCWLGVKVSWPLESRLKAP